MPKEPTRKSQRKDAGDVQCDWCGQKDIRRRGLASHKKACPKRPELDRAPEAISTSAVLHAESEGILGAQHAEESDEALEYVDETEDTENPGAVYNTGSAEDGEDEQSEQDDDTEDDEIFLHHHVVNLMDHADNESSEDEGLSNGDSDQNDDIDVEMGRHTSASPPLNSPGQSYSTGHGSAIPDITGSQDSFQSTFHINKNHSLNNLPDPDEIRVEYHPKSGEKPLHFSFYEFTPEKAAKISTEKPADIPIDEEPWRPFSTCLDFEIADLILETHMNSQQTDKLMSLIRKCIADPTALTLNNNKDLQKTWEAARKMRTTEFKHAPLDVPYPLPGAPDHTLEFDLWHQSLWEWCDGLLDNPTILSQFRWHAQRIFKWDETASSFKRHIDEPWTADAWWNVQSQLPDDGVPLCIILYADKTQLSSFGTAKAYPVLARCANLPVDMRNGRGVAGGRLVGWLPIVEEDSEDTRKPRFIKLKRVVWHVAFKKILETLVALAHSGRYKHCADGILRHIFPIILILSADYEEQCFMAAIRGLRSAHPCPTCIVHANDMTNPETIKVTPLRTTQDMKDVHSEAHSLGVARKGMQKEALLQAVGLRDVENAFWSLDYTDVYSAISWDRLHAYHGGLFSRHLWKLFQSFVTDKDFGLGKKAAKQIDNQVGQVPRWSDLYHFSAIMQKGEFYTDGRKYEDMSKIIVFVSHNVLSVDASPNGYLLLQLIRSYVELDMHASLVMQSTDTIASGERELLHYHTILASFKRAYSDKDWNFPKAHSHFHMFSDIRLKGVTRNFNSKPNESAHRPLKKFYLLHTNFKNVDKQILRLDVSTVASIVINAGIEALDNHMEPLNNAAEDENDLNTASGGSLTRVTLGSKRKPMTVQEVASSSFATVPERAHAFKDFRKKIIGYLKGAVVPDPGHPEPPKIVNSHQIMPYYSVKVLYDSVIEWTHKSNILRCNPDFHHQERYDYALVKVDTNSFIFAQLLFLFSIQFRGVTHKLALILPMDVPPPLAGRIRDTTLRFTCILARPYSKSVIVDINTLVRGALLVPEYGAPFEIGHTSHIVVDTIDADMWWRMKSTHLEHHVKI